MSSTKPFQVIPAIDLLGGKVVRLKQGDYNQVTYYDQSPAEIAKLYEEAGAQRIHIVDLDGAKDGQLVNYQVLKDIRSTVSCDIEFGGGIRSMDMLSSLFDIGINYVVLGSLLSKDWNLCQSMFKQYPHQLIAGIDVKDGVFKTSGWTEAASETLQSMIQKVQSEPVESIIFTDISTDGMMTGPNLMLLKEISATTSTPIISSGGIRHLEDIESVQSLKSNGIVGCIIGKAILDGTLRLSSLWK